MAKSEAGNAGKLIRRARRLYIGYKTSTDEYKRLSELLGFQSSGQLNAHICKSKWWQAHRAKQH